MIEIKVNDEVRDVKAELAMGLTGLQIFWIFCGIVAGAITGFAFYRATPLPLAFCAYISMLPAAPFAVLAFKEWHEMNAAEAAKLFITRVLFDPKVKTYAGDNEIYLKEKKLLAMQAKIEKQNHKEAIKIARKESKQNGSNKND